MPEALRNLGPAYLTRREQVHYTFASPRAAFILSAHKLHNFMSQIRTNLLELPLKRATGTSTRGVITL